MSKAKRSINLYPKNGNNSGSEAEESDGENDATVLEGNKLDFDNLSSWSKGGKERNKLISQIVSLSSKFVSSTLEESDLPDGRRVMTKKYNALPDAAQVAFDLKKLLEVHDNPDTRDLTILMHRYQILQSQLLPLLSISINEGLTARYCLRIISRLLVPISPQTCKVLCSGIKDHKKDETKEDSVARIELEKKRKDNAVQQIAALLSFKECLVADDVLFAAVCQTLALTLRKRDKERSDGENQMIETVLHILSNLTSLHTLGYSATVAEKVKAADLQCKLMSRFEGAIFDIIITFCESISVPIFKDNLNFFIDLLCGILRGFDAKDLFRVWRTLPTPSTDAVGGKIPKPTSVVPAPSPVEKRAFVAPTNGLLSQITKERQDRMVSLQTNSHRSNRLGAMFTVRPYGSSGLSERGEPDAGAKVQVSFSPETSNTINTTQPVVAHAMITQNPFKPIEENIPKMKERKIKRNQPFAVVDQDPMQDMQSLSERQQTQAMSSLIPFMEKFTKKGFKMLVHAVKEDLRRDENKVGFGVEELEYFSIISSCLKYHRLKVVHDRECHLLGSKTESYTVVNADGEPKLPESNGKSWTPDIRCMMAALDKMSFRRVIEAIRRLINIEKKFDVVHIPLETYKEMICYIYLMLQSSNPAHHELAVAALYPLFYTNPQDKLDPLLLLLRDWRLGVYSRKHSHLIVELVHETLKTLEAARACLKYRESYSSKVKENPAIEESITRYINAALKFDELDYFERLVSNHTVRFYTTLLSDYKMMTPQVEHYVFSFLQRMYSHKIESDKFGVLYNQGTKGTNNGVAEASSSVNLGYLLFNIRTLFAINDILNASASSKHYSPLVRLLICVVRSFAELANKNHMMFVECLFQHPHPFDFCFSLETVYDAATFAAGGRSQTSAPRDRSDGYSSESDVERTPQKRPDLMSPQARPPVSSTQSPTSYDFGDEFDENELPSTFMRLKKVKATKKSRSSRSIDDDEVDSSSRNRSPKSKSGHSKWSDVEDQILREQFNLYRNTYSCFDSIAAHPTFSGVRSSSDIKRRVKSLGLKKVFYRDTTVMSTPVTRMSDVVDDSEGVDDAELFQNGSMKLTTPHSTDDSGSSDSDEEMDFGGGDSSPQISKRNSPVNPAIWDIAAEDEDPGKWVSRAKVVSPTVGDLDGVRKRQFKKNSVDDDDEVFDDAVAVGNVKSRRLNDFDE